MSLFSESSFKDTVQKLTKKDENWLNYATWRFESRISREASFKFRVPFKVSPRAFKVSPRIQLSYCVTPKE